MLHIYTETMQPATGWAASETSQGTRDTVQRILMGQVGAWGTGAIPKDAIVEIKRAAHGVPDAIETILVRHGGGGDVQAGTSRITLKTYDQGRARWQGETLDFVWFDEEPPEDIYFEGLTRTNARNGIVTLTFVPPSRRAFDLDGCLSRMKSGLDGLADVLGVDDRHWSLTIQREDAVGGFVRAEIEVRE